MKQTLIILLIIITLISCEKEKYTGSVKFVFHLHGSQNVTGMGHVYIYSAELPELELISNPEFKENYIYINVLNPGNYIIEYNVRKRAFQIIAGKEQVVHLY